MAFTGRLGTDDSQLGQIELGFGGDGGTTVETSFTADAFIELFFRADAFISSPTQPTFFADATILRTQSASFTADAIVLRTQATSFTADAFKRITQTASFTANATKRKIVSTSFSVDAYLPGSLRQQHARTGPHTGTDTDLDHLIAWSFDRYWRGENLHEILVDIDARLTAREGGLLSVRHLLFAGAVRRVLRSASFTADAYYVIRVLTSFTADAWFADAFLADSWITDPAIYLDDDVLTAPTWPINATPRAAWINTASLTGDAVNDPSYSGTPGDYRTAWAKFTLSSTTTVILDTIGTDGDTVLELWDGGPPSWPVDPVGYSDDDVDNLPGSGYGNAEYLEVELTAGTYWALVHMYDEDDADFSMLLRMQTTT